jgi:hypothetical protein
MIEQIRKYLKSIEQSGIPQLSVNCVVFGFHDKTLKVVVNKVSILDKTILVLPGGYVRQNENLSDAIQGIVKESTGLDNIMLKQFAVFGDASRSFGKEFLNLAGKTKSVQGKHGLEWFSKRFISICYMALVDYNKIKLRPTEFLESAEWLPVEKSKSLAMDHSDMVKSARESLLKELPYSPIVSNLLSAKFTLPELHALVQAILGREIDRPNFRRKVLASDLIVKVGSDDSGRGRPADLYTFRYGKKTSLTDELKFGF